MLICSLTTACGPSGEYAFPTPKTTVRLPPTIKVMITPSLWPSSTPTFTPTPSPQPTPAPTRTPLPTLMVPTPTAAVPVSDLRSVQCRLGWAWFESAPWFSLGPSERDGWCLINSYTQLGYSIIYPQDWDVNPVGADATNLSFGMLEDHRLFLYVSHTDFPLESADQTIDCFEASCAPFVDPSEIIIEKNVVTIGDKQTLALVATKDDTLIRRYFLLGPEHLYVFESTVLEPDADAAAYQEFVATTEDMISAMRFEDVSISEALPFLPDVSGEIVFEVAVSNYGGGVHTMNADGTNVVRLTDYEICRPESPAWSPDRQRIAFACRKHESGSFMDIYVMNADGTGQRRLTTSHTHSSYPDWSPDGERIVFVSKPDGHYEIYTMNDNGTLPTRLTHTPDIKHCPAWSPDGTRIAFMAFVSGPIRIANIYMMNADGTALTPLTDDLYFDGCPIWSPDGTRIAFTSSRSGTPDIFVMNADGTDMIRITTSPIDEYALAWSPDGKYILFSSYKPTYLYMTSLDGQFLFHLPGRAGSDLTADW
ncbi:MAG: hypothetical protein GY832_46700 [Chloroflexi bacterium]|nr:hypothetical protein [Chloroflexota bacterium]